MDGDTTINEIKRIYKVLDKGRLRGRIKYILLDTDESVKRWWLHDYSDIQIGDIELKEGENHVILRVSKELNLDYITLS